MFICCLTEKVINTIKSLYNESKTTFKIGNVKTGWVESNRGVKQGCVLSPLLFAIFMEELTLRVKSLNVRVEIGGNKLAILLFADDVILVAESADDLKKMLNTVGEFEKETYIRFSKEKSQIMIIKGNNLENQEKFEMNKEELNITNTYTYLGLEIKNNGFIDITENKIATAEGWVGQMGGIMSSRKNKYEVSREIWKGVAVPKIMFGLEALNTSRKFNNKLETTQRRIGRMG